MENPVCYRFEINTFKLDITVDVVESLSRLVVRTGLKDVSLNRLFNVFTKFSSDGLLTKEQYDSAVRQLIPSGGLTAEEKKEFALVLSTLFFAFDRTETNVVDAVELCCGFSVLCAGY